MYIRGLPVWTMRLPMVARCCSLRREFCIYLRDLSAVSRHTQRLLLVAENISRNKARNGRFLLPPYAVPGQWHRGSGHPSRPCPQGNAADSQVQSIRAPALHRGFLASGPAFACLEVHSLPHCRLGFKPAHPCPRSVQDAQPGDATGARASHRRSSAARAHLSKDA